MTPLERIDYQLTGLTARVKQLEATVKALTPRKPIPAEPVPLPHEYAEICRQLSIPVQDPQKLTPFLRPIIARKLVRDPLFNISRVATVFRVNYETVRRWVRR